jgi:adenylate cyclase
VPILQNPLYPRFDSQDETLLKTFGAQAAVAVRNSRLFEKTENALKQSDALLEIANALSSELKIEGLISIICSKVQSLLHCERCTVFVVDKERKELYTSESMSFGMGASLPIDKERAKLIYFPLDRGLVGAVASGQVDSINIADAYKDSRFNKAMDKETGFRTRAIACVPIKNSAQEVCGVLQVMNKLSPTGVPGTDAINFKFNDDDEQMLRAFCAQAAVAIENSKLFTQTEKALNHALSDQRNLKFMLSVTKNLFSDMHLTSMIDQMTMQVHHLLKADGQSNRLQR